MCTLFPPVPFPGVLASQNPREGERLELLIAVCSLTVLCVSIPKIPNNGIDVKCDRDSRQSFS